MTNNIHNIIKDRKNGILCGIPSYCTANEIVLDALIKNAKKRDCPILIEATSNQVNQDLGYTGMDPFDFVNYLNKICDENHYPREKLIIGGDHLGPLPWANLPASDAMKNAELLARMCVRAGFKKIHIDTTMKLGDDPEDYLPTEVIATRAAILYRACEEEYQKRKEELLDDVHPVFVIGSEVPYAGGIKSECEDVAEVTTPGDFKNTLEVFHKIFSNLDMTDAWKHIVAIVVQPGVDFAANQLQIYDSKKSAVLCSELKKYPGMVFEGHSTDYQPREILKQMVEDGIAILKVGPALTFALREALFALSFIEDLYYDEEDRSHIRCVLENVMLSNRKNWEKYYEGPPKNVTILRSYGLSDRCRYFLVDDVVNKSINKLIDNIDRVDVTLGQIHQFFPNQFYNYVCKRNKVSANELIREHILAVVRNYEYATEFKYVIK